MCYLFFSWWAEAFQPPTHLDAGSPLMKSKGNKTNRAVDDMEAGCTSSSNHPPSPSKVVRGDTTTTTLDSIATGNPPTHPSTHPLPYLNGRRRKDPPTHPRTFPWLGDFFPPIHPPTHPPTYIQTKKLCT